MAFANRRTELDRLAHFAAAVELRAPERNLAFTGVRRIGKSTLIEEFLRRSQRPLLTVPIQVDSASSTLQAFLLAMVRATISALAAHRGNAYLPSFASEIEIASAAGAAGRQVSALTERALSLTTARNPDGGRVFEAGVSFPAEVGRAVDLPVIVFADEFQRLASLATYKPFKMPGRPEKEARQALLAMLRPHIERRPHYGWVVAGSNVRLLHDLLGSGPLMGRFEEVQLGHFDADDCAQLVRSALRELGAEPTDSAVSRVFRLTGGHPFYADVTCREAALSALRLGQTVSAAMIDRAFLDAIHRPGGQIRIACEEMLNSLTDRAPGHRGLLDALASIGEATLTELAEAARINSVPNVYRYAQELERLGLIQRGPDGTYGFVDPVFRYYVAEASDPLRPQADLANPDAARSAVRRFEEAFLREREERGQLTEGYVRDVLRSFGGQQVDGRYFGRGGTHIALPHSEGRAERIVAADPEGRVFGWPAEVELDFCVGSDTPWLGEVKDQRKQAGAADIELVRRKADFLRAAHGLAPGPAWVISFGGFRKTAQERALELGVLTSTKADLEAVKNLTNTRRPTQAPRGR